MARRGRPCRSPCAVSIHGNGQLRARDARPRRRAAPAAAITAKRGSSRSTSVSTKPSTRPEPASRAYARGPARGTSCSSSAWSRGASVRSRPDEEADEERVGLQVGGVAGQDEPDRAGARVGQRAGVGARLPAQLGRRLQDPRPRLPADARAVVDGEGDGGGGHAGAPRDVGDRRARRGVGGWAVADRGKVGDPSLSALATGGATMRIARAVGLGLALATLAAGSAHGGRRAVGRPAARRPPRGRGGDAGPGARVRGRPVLRPGLAHHGRDGRHRHAAAQAARLRLVRRRRPVDRAGDAVHERRRATSRYDLPRDGGHRLQRTDVAPDGRRGALLGLELPTRGRHSRTVRSRSTRTPS